MFDEVVCLEGWVPFFAAPVAVGVAFHEGCSVCSVLGGCFSVACHRVLSFVVSVAFPLLARPPGGLLSDSCAGSELCYPPRILTMSSLAAGVLHIRTVTVSRFTGRTVLAPRWVGLLPYFRSVHTGRVQTPTRPWSYSVVRDGISLEGCLSSHSLENPEWRTRQSVALSSWLPRQSLFNP